MTIAEKETRKLDTIHHGAYVSVINDVDSKDYSLFSSNTGQRHTEKIVSDYRGLIRLVEASDPSQKKLSLVERCICFIMALRNSKTFHLSGKVKKGTKVSTLNERLIVEAVLYYLSCSTYKILDNHKKIIANNTFDYIGFENGHKRELSSYKKALLDLLMQSTFDDQTAMAILNQIYLRGVMYKEGLSLDFEDKIKGRLIATEVIEVPRIEQSMSQEYLEYKKRMRY